MLSARDSLRSGDTCRSKVEGWKKTFRRCYEGVAGWLPMSEKTDFKSNVFKGRRGTLCINNQRNAGKTSMCSIYVPTDRSSKHAKQKRTEPGEKHRSTTAGEFGAPLSVWAELPDVRKEIEDSSDTRNCPDPADVHGALRPIAARSSQTHMEHSPW